MNHPVLQCRRSTGRGPARAAALAVLLSFTLGSTVSLAAMDSSASENAAGGTAAGSQQPNFQNVMKMSNLLHKDVKDSSGNEVASVEDLAIDLKTARVDYVILSTGGVLGAGNRMIAVPPEVFHQAAPAGGENTGGVFGGGNNRQFSISLADNQLRSMKAVDMNQWNALSEPSFFSETYQAAGVQAPATAQPSGPLAQGSKLLGADVKDRQGKHIGDINDVAVDLQNAAAPFTVVAYGGILGVGTKKTAVPTPDLSQLAGNKEGVTVAATEDQIKKGPAINEQQWRSIDAQWVSNMYAQYGLTPYWQAASSAPGTGPGSAAQFETQPQGQQNGNQSNSSGNPTDDSSENSAGNPPGNSSDQNPSGQQQPGGSSSP